MNMMPRRLNKQSYVFQLLGEEAIKDYYLAPVLQQFLNQMIAHKYHPTSHDCCVFTQDSPEPRYSKIFTRGTVCPTTTVVVASD